MNNLQELTNHGVSIWLDYLSKNFIATGDLKNYIDEQRVVGVTTNPAIFHSSITKDDSYTTPAKTLLQQDKSLDLDSLLFKLITEDVQAACEVFLPVYQATSKKDGYVSIEVSPDLADDFDGSVKQAKELWRTINKPNLMIKIPATTTGIKVIESLISEGISVNATLIFSNDQYAQVAEAYLAGLKSAKENDRDLTSIHSVASIFVSRIDTAVDQQLSQLSESDNQNYLGKAGVYNALNIFENFQQIFSKDDFKILQSVGASIQRPLWASTGVKDPSLPKNYYAMNLDLPDTVNTLPKETIDFLGDASGLEEKYTLNSTEKENYFSDLAERNINLPKILKQLEIEGVKKFVEAWNELKASLREKYFND